MAAISFINQNIHFPAANEFIGKKYQSKNRNQTNNRPYMLNLHWPNQRLNLTEPAVDDVAARRWTDLAPMIGTSAQRTTWR